MAPIAREMVMVVDATQIPDDIPLDIGQQLQAARSPGAVGARAGHRNV